MTPELLKLIEPRITPRVMEIVNRHLTEEQIGLLLVKLINPYFIMSQEQEATLRGVNRKTLRGMKERGEVTAHRSSALSVNAEDAPKLPKIGPKTAKTTHSSFRKQKPL